MILPELFNSYKCYIIGILRVQLPFNYPFNYPVAMITEEVIKEIYKNYNKPAKTEEELNLPYIIDLLSANHKLIEQGDEIVVESIEEFSPFRRFLKRGLYAVLEFDRNVAFVFKNHILFFSKKSPQMSVHFAPAKEPSIWDKIFGNND